MKRTNYWILADTHFGHDKLVKSGYRPDNFEEKILANLAAAFKPGDVLIHLGDVAFYKTKYWHERLLDAQAGMRHWLIKGNHDHETMGWYLDRGWDVVCEELTINMYGYDILFTHKPIKLRHRFDINVHGHLHNLEWRHSVTRFFNILVQIEDTLAPVKLETLVNDWRNKYDTKNN